MFKILPFAALILKTPEAGLPEGPTKTLFTVTELLIVTESASIKAVQVEHGTTSPFQLAASSQLWVFASPSQRIVCACEIVNENL